MNEQTKRARRKVANGPGCGMKMGEGTEENEES
jgi:hypothetical protein